jgi:hypothetical protein
MDHLFHQDVHSGHNRERKKNDENKSGEKAKEEMHIKHFEGEYRKEDLRMEKFERDKIEIIISNFKQYGRN